MPDEQTPYHARKADDVVSALEVDPGAGLSSDEAAKRLEKYGPNALEESKGRSPWSILLGQVKSAVIIVLAVAGVVALVAGEYPEAIAIAAVVVVNGGIGFFSEWKAVRSMQALKALGERNAMVMRDGEQRELPVDELVPGDIVVLNEGDVIPADLRLVEANRMRVDEASLTGESVAANKRTDPVGPDTDLAERQSMVYKGTVLRQGSGHGVVVATGGDTEIGRIAELTTEVEEAASDDTPLEKRLDRLGRRLAVVCLVAAVVIAGVGLLAGHEMRLMLETAIALGLAAVPEGLPIVATIALAHGMWQMARRRALINRLGAVETLGATSVIFSDKTGTLTANRMVLNRIATPNGGHELPEQCADGSECPEPPPFAERLLRIGVLCGNASESDGEILGDPTEAGLVRGAMAHGMRRDNLLEDAPEEREVAFDPEAMMMATYHRDGQDGLFVAVKGAPDAVLDACARIDGEDGPAELPDDAREEWRGRSEEMANEGFRVLAGAWKRVDNDDAEPYEDLVFAGLFGLWDPPREDVPDSIADCQRAGIRVIMVTGDQPATAAAIGERIGLFGDDGRQVMHSRDLKDPAGMSREDRERVLNTAVFARMTPEQKLWLIRVFQEEGYVVAMTGDGVNDTPALSKAEIGVAMGQRGTDAAKEAADMVLQDDDFPDIVSAVRQGRVIFDNIRKATMFMLCTNLAEILVVATAAIAGWTLPLRPLQILYLNVLTDAFPALALGVGKGVPEMMQRPPRPSDEGLLTKRHWAAIAGWAVLVGASIFGAYFVARDALGLQPAAVVTVSFLTLGAGKLWFPFNLRSRGTTVFRNDVVMNPWIWGAIALCIVLLAATLYVPGLKDVMRTVPLGWTALGVVLAFSLVPLVVGQALRGFQRHGLGIRDGDGSPGRD